MEQFLIYLHYKITVVWQLLNQPNLEPSPDVTLRAFLFV